MDWIDDAPRALGLPAITADNAIELARRELPCYSRLADDCLVFSDEGLARHGLTERCARIIALSTVADRVEWEAFIEALPYCPDYFDYGRERAQGPSPVITAAAGFVLGLAIGAVVG